MDRLHDSAVARERAARSRHCRGMSRRSSRRCRSTRTTRRSRTRRSSSATRFPTRRATAARSPKGTRQEGFATACTAESSGARSRMAIHEIELIKRARRAAGRSSSRAAAAACPSTRDPKLGLEGIDAVVDKDLAAAVLARRARRRAAADSDRRRRRLRGLGNGHATRAAQSDGDRSAKRWTQRRRSGKEAWRRRFAPRSTSCSKTGGRAIITELSRGLEAVHGRAGTTIAH